MKICSLHCLDAHSEWEEASLRGRREKEGVQIEGSVLEVPQADLETHRFSSEWVRIDFGEQGMEHARLVACKSGRPRLLRSARALIRPATVDVVVHRIPLAPPTARYVELGLDLDLPPASTNSASRDLLVWLRACAPYVAEGMTVAIPRAVLGLFSARSVRVPGQVVRVEPQNADPVARLDPATTRLVIRTASGTRFDSLAPPRLLSPRLQPSETPPDTPAAVLGPEAERLARDVCATFASHAWRRVLFVHGPGSQAAAQLAARSAGVPLFDIGRVGDLDGLAGEDGAPAWIWAADELAHRPCVLFVRDVASLCPIWDRHGHVADEPAGVALAAVAASVLRSQRSVMILTMDSSVPSNLHPALLPCVQDQYGLDPQSVSPSAVESYLRSCWGCSPEEAAQLASCRDIKGQPFGQWAPRLADEAWKRSMLQAPTALREDASRQWFVGLERLRTKVLHMARWCLHGLGPQAAIPLSEEPALLNAIMRPPRGVVLYGPPGTGKTLLASEVARNLAVPLRSVDVSQLMAAEVGEAERRLRSELAAAVRAAPCVVLLDEVQAMFAARGDSTVSWARTLLAQLYLELDGWAEMGPKSAPQVFLVACTNELASLDSAFFSAGRFECALELPLPDMDSREKILAAYLDVYCPLADSAGLAYQFSMPTGGFSGAELRLLVEEALAEALTDPLRVSKRIEAADLSVALNYVRNSKCLT